MMGLEKPLRSLILEQRIHTPLYYLIVFQQELDIRLQPDGQVIQMEQEMLFYQGERQRNISKELIRFMQIGQYSFIPSFIPMMEMKVFPIYQKQF